ncbi:phenylalanine--tRNA ligase subunit beta [Flocculibacter collagenilyticus]|uniref:phenylalanine--tRNA ligase subunit beta n=1 Tax=Flocculibacter collagenilyticus TaxID=2744479 RepID=UPI0018F37957|nr:phenylalanine--tRNA ligase subunit beta [Flocculibacter collagenilyticus]
MKFSEKWLREWVNPQIATNELAEQLSMAGLEVDGVEPVAGDFTGVKVGKVVECGQHPDADKLQVTKIDIGEDELLDIVCGAKNCRLGLKVAVATVGAVLPGDFKIKKAKLRGQPSFGMLCSESELGMAESADGILELPEDAPVGQCIREYLSLDDSAIEVDLTPNRADCLGMIGLAREVGVLNNANVNELTFNNVTPSIDDTRDITLSSPEDCPRYLGRVIKNVDVSASSPLWLIEKLRRSGIRSIDPVVDVTNYVLLELGHPMHAFDLDKIEGHIDVRLAKQDETLVLLDGNEAKLKKDTLVIADSEKALAIAGVFGGEHSGVNSDTTNIFLESAFFSPEKMMGKARGFGLHTDASHRYERGVDPELQRTAMERATQLLVEIVGGEVGPIVEAKSDEHIPQARPVTLRRARLDRVLGLTINTETVTEALTRLGFDVKLSDEGSEAEKWDVVVPAYRFDITIEEDLIEEVARIYGYNNIQNISPKASLVMNKHQESNIALSRFRDMLVDKGYQEAITYSFVDPKVQSMLHPESEAMILPHPISIEMSAMRVSLFTGLLQTAVYNQNRQQSRIRLFETGLSFIPDENAENGVRQQPRIAGLIAGSAFGEHWNLESRTVDFFDLKGDVEVVLSLMGTTSVIEFKPAKHSALHPGQTANIYVDGHEVGVIGAVHPEFEKKLGLNGKTFVFELDLNAISNRNVPEAMEVSKYPSNRRDIAVVVKEEVNAGNLLSLIKNIGANQLVDLKLFDVYQGKGVEEGYKSLAIGITLQDQHKTLEDNEINDSMTKVIEALQTEFNATLRD